MFLLSMFDQVCRNVYLGLRSLKKAKNNGTKLVKILIYISKN
jgi:hypothetical protein